MYLKYFPLKKDVIEVSETINMLFEGAIVRAHILQDLQSAIKARTAVEKIILSELK